MAPMDPTGNGLFHENLHRVLTAELRTMPCSQQGSSSSAQAWLDAGSPSVEFLAAAGVLVGQLEPAAVL